MRIAFSIIACALLACCAIQSPQAGPVGFRLQSGFSPRQIHGLKLWLDASQITGLNDGDSVATWSDLSGNGNNATQGTASQRPTFQTNEQNGRPVVLFDGVDDTLATAAFASALSQPATIYCVVSRITTGTTYSDPVDGIAAGNRMVVAFENSTGNFAMFSGGPITFGGTVASGSGCQILTAIYNGASSLGFIDAASQAGLAASSGTHSLTGVLLGDAPIGGQAFNGRIAELLIYAGAHDASNRANVWAYLKAKWGTP